MTETGEEVTFIASAIDVALSARNSGGTQDLQFAVSNIKDKTSTSVSRTLENLRGATVNYRQYTSTI